mgnify:CR=1 FL=1
MALFEIPAPRRLLALKPMPYISLKNVGINFPIYGAGANSLKKTLAASVTGGRLGTETGVKVVHAV